MRPPGGGNSKVPPGDVPKWSKGAVCKTAIRRFESARRLQMFFALIAMAACSDPPDPPPAAHQSASQARWVAWADERAPVNRVVVLFVDTPGGRLDLLADHSDVATFLNDRFHPVFRIASSGKEPSIQFFTADGCPITEPLAPSDAAAFIEVANAVVTRPEAWGHTATFFSLACPRR